MQKTRRGPGRPKKKVEPPAIKREGIVQNPLNTECDPGDTNIVELLYTNPDMIKNIISMFKKMSSDYILIKFEKEGCIFYSQDHQQVSDIFCYIKGQKLHRYYCEEPKEIVVGMDNMKIISDMINKSIQLVRIYMKRFSNENFLYFSFENQALGNNKLFRVEASQHTINYDEFNETKMSNGDDYDLHWRFTFPQFKREIDNLNRHCGLMTIEKNPGEPLMMKSVSTDKKMKSTSKFTNSDAISLSMNRNTPIPISVEVAVAHLVSFSKCSIPSLIQISIARGKPLLFSCVLDGEKNSSGGHEDGTETAIIRVFTIPK